MAVFTQISRDPQADPRTGRAFDQLKELLKIVCVTRKSSVTRAGNTAATQTTLFSYTVPANELSNNDSLTFEAAGTFAATAATDKRIRVKFGSTTIYDSGTLNITTAESWVLRGTVTRSGASAQKCDVLIATSSATLVAKGTYATAAEDLSATVLLVITGQGTNLNDVVGERFKVIHQPS